MSEFWMPMKERDSQDASGAGPAPDTGSRRGAVIGLIFLIVLVLGGLVLTHVLRDVSELQDCAMSGRTNCAPIDATSSGKP
jgi:hypothetical protein